MRISRHGHDDVRVTRQRQTLGWSQHRPKLPVVSLDAHRSELKVRSDGTIKAELIQLADRACREGSSAGGRSRFQRDN